MSDAKDSDLGLEDDIEPDADATEGVKGGASLLSDLTALAAKVKGDPKADTVTSVVPGAKLH